MKIPTSRELSSDGKDKKEVFASLRKPQLISSKSKPNNIGVKLESFFLNKDIYEYTEDRNVERKEGNQDTRYLA